MDLFARRLAAAAGSRAIEIATGNWHTASQPLLESVAGSRIGSQSRRHAFAPVVDTKIGRSKLSSANTGGCLLISYNSQSLQEVCFYPATAVKLLGKAAAASLQARHADMQAASNVFELPIGEVRVNRNVCTLTVPDVLSIVMSPNYATANDGAVLDWSTVRRVKLMGINDVE